MRKNPAHTIRRLYGNAHGYTKRPDEEREVRASGSSSMYGELMPTATAKLLDYLRLGKNDVLYDLGSGVGKVVLQAAISRPLKRVVGIEMMPSRYAVANRILDRIENENLLEAETCELWCDDFMKARLSDATVVYTCSTAFPPALMDGIADRIADLDRSVRLVTLQALDPDSRFHLVDVLRLDTSWKRREPVHIYDGLTELARVSRGGAVRSS